MASSWTPWVEGFGQLDGLDGLQCSPLRGRARAMTEEHYKLSKLSNCPDISVSSITLIVPHSFTYKEGFGFD